MLGHVLSQINEHSFMCSGLSDKTDIWSYTFIFIIYWYSVTQRMREQNHDYKSIALMYALKYVVFVSHCKVMIKRSTIYEKLKCIFCLSKILTKHEK